MKDTQLPPVSDRDQSDILAEIGHVLRLSIVHIDTRSDDHRGCCLDVTERTPFCARISTNKFTAQVAPLRWLLITGDR